MTRIALVLCRASTPTRSQRRARTTGTRNCSSEWSETCLFFPNWPLEPFYPQRTCPRGLPAVRGAGARRPTDCVHRQCPAARCRRVLNLFEARR